MIFQGYQISQLLLRIPETLSSDEATLLKDYYSSCTLKTIEENVVKENILPFAADVFANLKCDPEYWTQLHGDFVRRNQKVKSILDSIFEKSNELGCKSLTLTENFGVVLSSNSCIGCFTSSDVDLSADIREREEIIRSLEYFNFTVKERNHRKKNPFSEQITMFYNEHLIKGGFWINIMWVAVARTYFIQDKYNQRLFRERLLAIEIPDTKIRVLSETPLLYFCALHIASGHYYTLTPGIKLYVDIDRLVRCCNINWETILEWTEQDNAGLRIALVMYLCHQLFDTDIPEKVYGTLLKNRRNTRLINYLYVRDTKNILGNAGKFHRLFIELASDGDMLTVSVMKRLYHLLKAIF